MRSYLPDKSYWLSGGFPAHLQAAAAVGAIALAIFAFADWKTQERLKRQADYAMEALRGLIALDDCMVRRRPNAATSHLGLYPDWAQLAKDFWEVIEKECSATATSFKASAEIAERVLSPEIGVLMKRYSRQYQQVSRAQGWIIQAKNERLTTLRDVVERRLFIKWMYPVAGIHHIPISRLEQPWSSVDAFRDRVVETRDTLVEALAHRATLK